MQILKHALVTIGAIWNGILKNFTLSKKKPLKSVRSDILKFKYAYNAQSDSWIDYGMQNIVKKDKYKTFDKFVKTPLCQQIPDIFILIWIDIFHK